MLCPPLHERFIVGYLVSDFPVELRYGIVYPSLVYPEEDIGIEVIVVL